MDGIREQFSYSVHARDDGKVGRSIILSRKEEADSLSSGDVDHLSFSGLGVYAVNFDDAHRVSFYPDVLSSKSANVENAEHVSLIGLHGNGQILSFIHEHGLGHRLSALWVVLCEESWEKSGHLVMVPVRES